MQQSETKHSIQYPWGEEKFFLFSSAPNLEALIQEDYRIIRIFTTDKHVHTNQYPFCILGNITNSDDKKYWLIQAIKGDIKSFHYIKNKEQIIGAQFISDQTQQCFLTGIQGRERSVFAQLETYIPSDQQIVRMWNFMENIDQNYVAFNTSRDGFFQKHDITDYPAATGIETYLGGEELSVSIDAVTGSLEALEITTLQSDLQNEACDYGPKFSRGKVVHFKKEGIRKIYISGTSSVDKEGQSIFCNEPKENVTYVLECVEHLLKKTKSDFHNIVMSIVYCKDKAHYEAFLALYKKRHWDFPYMPLFVNICRRNLSFEIECVAWS